MNKKLGKFRTNIGDPNCVGAKDKFLNNSNISGFVAGYEAGEKAWQDRLDYISQFVIGPPKPGKKCTSKYLKEMGVVGLYEPLEINKEVQK